MSNLVETLELYPCTVCMAYVTDFCKQMQKLNFQFLEKQTGTEFVFFFKKNCFVFKNRV